jgi:hypothetical protein
VKHQASARNRSLNSFCIPDVSAADLKRHVIEQGEILIRQNQNPDRLRWILLQQASNQHIAKMAGGSSH